MRTKKNSIQLEAQKTIQMIKRANDQIIALGYHCGFMNEAINIIQEKFDAIRNISSEQKEIVNEAKKIKNDWNKKVSKLIEEKEKLENIGKTSGTAGVLLGSSIATMGPTAAMGIATTFGVASTQTAISTLSGAAATKAALAWLGGGALASGGGGIAAGEALLAMAGPIGWSIAGVAFLAGGIIFILNRRDRKQLVKVYLLINERDQRKYDLACTEINERIKALVERRETLIKGAVRIAAYGDDYNEMSEAQKNDLGALFNCMKTAVEIIVKPIDSLIPKFDENKFEDLSKQCAEMQSVKVAKKFIIYIVNLLNGIDLSEAEWKNFAKSLKKNKDLLKNMEVDKVCINDTTINLAKKISDRL